MSTDNSVAIPAPAQKRRWMVWIVVAGFAGAVVIGWTTRSESRALAMPDVDVTPAPEARTEAPVAERPPAPGPRASTPAPAPPKKPARRERRVAAPAAMPPPISPQPSVPTPPPPTDPDAPLPH